VAHNVACQRPGGVSRIMRFIHDEVSNAGHQIEYLCAEDVPVWVRGRWGRLAFPWAVRAKVSAARRAGRPYHLVNVHEPSGAAVSVLRSGRGYPVITVTSHGLERRAWEFTKEEARLGRQGPTLKTRILYPLTSLWQSKLALRYADYVFCLNLEDRDYLVRRLRIPGARITRIYPGADTCYATATTGRDYARVERVLFAATWRKNKGVEDLVPAFQRLAVRHETLTLTVLGGGVPADVVLGAFPPEVRGRVRSIQTTTEAETAARFASSDLFLLPSLFEGTPLVLIEAMMSGLPIVTTATCGMKDVIRSEHNGLLVPIRSPAAIVTAMERLVADPQLRARLGLAAQRDALQQYTWPAVARPVRETYERLAGLAR
jgi:glycosyltransferase involved in cell wall biosynthesis